MQEISFQTASIQFLKISQRNVFSSSSSSSLSSLSSLEYNSLILRFRAENHQNIGERS